MKDKRDKNCQWCQKPFRDTSKRLSQRTCSVECSRAWGVARRKANGSYNRTEEQNRKMVASIQKAREEGRCIISLEKRMKLSEKLKAHWASGKMAEQTKQTSLEKYGEEHWMKTVEAKERNSKLHKGRVVSVLTRRKLSLNSRKQTHRFSRCRGGYREDLDLYVRSSWEANFARYLNYHGKTWEYETDTFELTNGMSYTPDFKIGNCHYVEIKGWLTEKAKSKLSMFKAEYPYVILDVVSRNEYRKLYSHYSTLIDEWEKIST